MLTISKDEFIDQATAKFGNNRDLWKFVCPSCKTEQSIQDFKAANVEDHHKYIGFSCIGRFDESKGCNWTLGGLFKIHEMEVIDGDNVIPFFKLAQGGEDFGIHGEVDA